jgi:anti-anti-sigma factor
MQIAVNDAGSTATITLTGRLDIVGADAIALPLATLSNSKSNIVVDMTAVTFIASIGLRHLVSAAKAVARRGGRVVLLNPSAAVAEVVTTSGLADLLHIERGDAPQS